MIVPSEVLKSYVNGFATRREVCDRLDIDEASLSKYLAEERDCSPKFIEAILRHTGFVFEKAFELKMIKHPHRREDDK